MKRIMGFGVFPQAGLTKFHIMYCNDNGIGKIAVLSGAHTYTAGFLRARIAFLLECAPEDITISPIVLEQLPVKVK